MRKFYLITILIAFLGFNSSFYNYTITDKYDLFGPIQIILTIFLLLSSFFSIFSQNSFGKKITYVIIPLILYLGGRYLYAMTNYYFYDKFSAKKAIATVKYKRIARGTSRFSKSKYYEVDLYFDNGHMIKIDHEMLYDKLDIGDKVSLFVYNGYWGIPVVQEKDFKAIKIYSKISR